MYEIFLTTIVIQYHNMHITTNEAASRIHKGRTTIIQDIRRGRLKAIKIGRDWLIDEHDLYFLVFAPDKRKHPHRSSKYHPIVRQINKLLLKYEKRDAFL